MSGGGEGLEGREGAGREPPPGTPEPERESWFRRRLILPFLGVLFVGLLLAGLSSPFVAGWTLISRGIRGTWLWDAPSLFGIAGVLCLLFLRLDRRRPRRPWVRRAAAASGGACICLALPAVMEVLLKPVGTGTLVFLVLWGAVTGPVIFGWDREP